jgi:hypothetical protein
MFNSETIGFSNEVEAIAQLPALEAYLQEHNVDLKNVINLLDYAEVAGVTSLNYGSVTVDAKHFAALRRLLDRSQNLAQEKASSEQAHWLSEQYADNDGFAHPELMKAQYQRERIQEIQNAQKIAEDLARASEERRARELLFLDQKLQMVADDEGMNGLVSDRKEILQQKNILKESKVLGKDEHSVTKPLAVSNTFVKEDIRRQQYGNHAQKVERVLHKNMVDNGLLTHLHFIDTLTYPRGTSVVVDYSLNQSKETASAGTSNFLVMEPTLTAKVLLGEGQTITCNFVAENKLSSLLYQFLVKDIPSLLTQTDLRIENADAASEWAGLSFDEFLAKVATLDSQRNSSTAEPSAFPVSPQSEVPPIIDEPGPTKIPSVQEVLKSLPMLETNQKALRQLYAGLPASVSIIRKEVPDVPGVVVDVITFKGTNKAFTLTHRVESTALGIFYYCQIKMSEKIQPKTLILDTDDFYRAIYRADAGAAKKALAELTPLNYLYDSQAKKIIDFITTTLLTSS